MDSPVIGIDTVQHDGSQIGLASVLSAYLAVLLWLAGYKYTLASMASVLNETTGILIMLLA